MCDGFSDQLATLDDAHVSGKCLDWSSTPDGVEWRGKNALLWNGFLLGVAVAFSRKNNVDGTVANGELQQGTDAHAQ
jgi:hypothetical protein